MAKKRHTHARAARKRKAEQHAKTERREAKAAEKAANPPKKTARKRTPAAEE
jgi:hypothetical protein